MSGGLARATPEVAVTSGPGPVLTPEPPRARPARVSWLALGSFALLVALPTAGLGTYYARHAADQFSATARFTVREAATRPLRLEDADRAPDRLGSALATAEISPFTHVVASYLDSPALLSDLSARFDIPAIFRRPEADAWSRLPDGVSAEALAAYWADRIRVWVDGPSGIVSLEIRAFRPADAEALARAAIDRAEALVNRLALRQKADARARALAETAAAEARLADTTRALARFRDTARVVDPAREGAATVDLLADLEAERIRLEAQRRVLASVATEDAARGRALETRLTALRADIARLRDLLAADATRDRNLAAALGRFEELEIRRRVAARLFGLAETRLIGAEIDLARQTVFLNLFDPPRRPEEPSHPRRAALTLLWAVTLAAGWAILALIWAAVADHRLDRRR